MEAAEIINEWDLLELANNRLSILRLHPTDPEGRVKKIEEIEAILGEVKRRFISDLSTRAAAESCPAPRSASLAPSA